MKSLNQDTDARRWAKEFTSIAKDQGLKIDEGWMLSWFANAIMCGYDEAMRKRNQMPWYKRVFKLKSW